ncbi:TonB-dependent receptor, partial [Pseudoalteromonas sp. NZS100_1]|nr:TonB-dependent receptor [Pseudoalteromonas sp. NZS100_1]
TNATVVTRANSRTDYIMCEADVRAGRITDFSQCSRAQTTSARRSGNPDLDPERAKTLSFGVVLEPPLPEEGAMILTTNVPASELRDRALTWLGSGLAGIGSHRR